MKPMKCNEYNLSEAQGVVLFDDIRLPGRILPRGSALTAEDIKDLETLGIKKIFGAEIDDKDNAWDVALNIIGARLSGDNTAYRLNENGILQFVALQNGVFVCSADRVARFNRLSENLILNTIPPYSLVSEGEVVAGLELTLPVMPEDDIQRIIMSLSGNVPLLSLAVDFPKRTALIYTNFYNDEAETAHFAAQVRKLVRDFADLQLDFVEEYYTPHTVEGLADSIQQAVEKGFDLVFIIPGQKNSSSRDVVPQALNSFVDEVVNYHIPEIGASDLLIAAKRQTRIISLPYNYDRISSPLLHEYVAKAVVNEKISSFDFAYPQNVLLPKGQKLNEIEFGQLAAVSKVSSDSQGADIAVVILAAGVSSRAKRNKLLAEVDGEPLFMKAVNAALQSKAGPVYLITGYQHEELEAYVENIDINVIYNPAFRSGVKTSIALGLNLVPGFCQGAVLLPADMPNVTAKHLDKMIDAFQKGKDKQVIMTNFKGIKRNPVLWSRSLFEQADLVPENADVRAVFMEHEDYTVLVNAGREVVVEDVTFPADIDKVQNS